MWSSVNSWRAFQEPSSDTRLTSGATSRTVTTSRSRRGLCVPQGPTVVRGGKGASEKEVPRGLETSKNTRGRSPGEVTVEVKSRNIQRHPSPDPKTMYYPQVIYNPLNLSLKL